MLAELPSGTVTFLFTDVEGSTRLWEAHPDAMRPTLARHDEILREVVVGHAGHVVKTTGDGLHAVFDTASDATAAVVDAQRRLVAEAWPLPEGLRVRMGLHTAQAELRDGDYYGSAVNRAARVASAAHGGQILVSHAAEELVCEALPVGVDLVDLGEHRLRDLGRPERLFQVMHTDLPREFSALRTLDSLPGNLPVQVTSFVGRDREIARVVDALGDARVVTLTGVGGVGKTRLALQVAAEVLPRFRDGAWLCELGAVRDPAGVVDAVALVFRVTARPGASLEESLVAFLRDQELLLVLDNCEHLLRPVAALVARIEAASVSARVLATSREGLNIGGEQLLTVPSLRLPDDELGVDRVGECEAVQLFTERARAVRADFAVDDTNRSDVVAVCTRLDGLALAIELAAARLPAMSPAELVRRLDRRFRLLSGGARVAIERHQTLRATIDWSYDLLAEPEQRLLARLSVFAGGWTLEAVEAVCSGELIEVDDVFELLARLVAHHLVVADAGPETRYRLLETIRQYGEQRLEEAGETGVLRARHADYYSGFASTTTKNMFGPGQVEWGIRLARERDNLHAAMAFALEIEDLDRAMRLLCAVPGLGVQINDLVIFDPAPVLALDEADTHPGSGRALMDSAFIASGSGALDHALELVDRALDAQARLGAYSDDPIGTYVWLFRAFVAESRGALTEAAELRLAAALEARAGGNPGMEACLLASSASTLAFIDADLAAARASEALELARRTGMPTAKVLSSLALAQALAHRDPDRAAALLQDAERVGYENSNEILFTVFAAAVLADWPLTLRATSRLLNLDRRSETISLLYLAGILNLAARGLADEQPESAAVIQGAVRGLLRRAAPPGPPPVPAAGPVGADRLSGLIASSRRDTTTIIMGRLAEPIVRELRAQGETMDRDQACAYTRGRIDEHLTQSAASG